MAPGTKPVHVFFYYANLIGYARVIFLIASFFYMPSDPVPAMVLYFTSSFLDAFDGMAARYFDQSSTFGGMLDMLTDRVGTMALIMSIATFEMYKSYTWLFQLICLLDIVAHWAHMYSNTLGGLKHHKTIDLEKNPILYFYYQKLWLFIFCSANELVYICLYLLNFYEAGSTVHTVCHFLVWPAGIIAFIKNLISVVHLYAAFYNIAVYDVGIDESSRVAPQSKEYTASPSKESSSGNHGPIGRQVSDIYKDD